MVEERQDPAQVRSVGPRGTSPWENTAGLGWLPDGTLVVSTLRELEVHHVDALGNLATTHDLSHLGSTTNDLVVALDGRACFDLYQLNASGTYGQIGLVEPGGNVRVVATGLAFPNGLGFLPDGSTLVVSETYGSRLLAFPVEPDGILGTAWMSK